MVVEVEYSEMIWFMGSGIFGLLGFCDSCGKFWNGERSWVVGLAYGGVECEGIPLEVLGCDIGGGVSKDGAYLFGIVISEDCECFERLYPLVG